MATVLDLRTVRRLHTATAFACGGDRRFRHERARSLRVLIEGSDSVTVVVKNAESIARS